MYEVMLKAIHLISPKSMLIFQMEEEAERILIPFCPSYMPVAGNHFLSLCRQAV